MTPDHERLYREAKILKPELVQAAAELVTRHHLRYRAVEEQTGLPWYIVGAIHYREGSCSFARRIVDGRAQDSAVWHEATCLALRGFYWPKPDLDVTTVADEAEFCERWNGIGYRRRNMPSPYLWSGTSHYVRGKYAADGQFDGSLVDKQAGCMAIRMLILGAASSAPSGRGTAPPSTTTDPPPPVTTDIDTAMEHARALLGRLERIKGRM